MLRTRRSPRLVLLALAALAAALVATYFAAMGRWVDCSIGGAPPCSAGSLWQLYVAAGGVPVAAAAAVESVRPAGRPLLWLGAAAVYGVWGVLAYLALS